METLLEDEARFEEGDEAVVIMASFACRACLSNPELVILAGAPGDRSGTSCCPRCEAVNVVSLTDAQAHQLWTLQRGNTFVHFAPELW